MKSTKAINVILVGFFILTLVPREIFALAAPITTKSWCHNFKSSSYDTEYSTVDRKNGVILLVDQGDGSYISSAEAWTDTISFSEDIYFLTLSGVYLKPYNTQVLVSATFGSEAKEYPLNWNAKFYPEGIYTKLKLRIFLATNDTAVTPTVTEICLKAELQDRSTGGITSRDNTRVSNLIKTQKILEKYYKDFNLYPIMNSDSITKDEQWQTLKNTLDSATKTKRKSYNSEFVDQVSDIDEENYKYGYLTGLNGGSYLLWVKLEDINSKKFKDSWVGSALSINCAAPIFCFYSKSDAKEEELVKNLDATSKKIYKIGTASFVRNSNDTKVWLKINNRKVWLRTPEIFTKAGGDWNKVSVTTTDQATLLKFFKKEGDFTIYVVNANGSKRALPNSEILSLYGKESEIVVFDDSKLADILPDNILVKSKNKPEIYFLTQGIKRWITAPDVFEKYKFSWDEVEIIEQKELDYYQEGNPMF